MANPIMPVFHQAAQEAAIIGRLITGYGELEYDLAMCLSRFTHDQDSAFRALFGIRAVRGRLHIADSLIQTPLGKLGLGPQYADAKGAIHRCLSIRNQYAHCHWGEYKNQELYFVNMEKEVEGPKSKSEFTYMRLSLPLLNEQEDYFSYTQNCFWFLTYEVDYLRDPIKNHPFLMPKKRPQPNLHNPSTTLPSDTTE